MTDVSISLPAKRRRGRPRKDANLPGKPIPPRSIGPARPGHLRPDASLRYNSQEVGPRPMVGSSISGVVEGLFDSGYLISVRIGNSGTPFRGVVFVPCKAIPVTPANPRAEMYQQREITGPFPNGPCRKPMIFQPGLLSLPLSADPCFGNQQAFVSQAIPPRVEPNQQWPPVHPVDEAFDVSSIDQASRVDGKLADFTCHNDMPKPTFVGMYYDGPNGPNATFHHDIFADRSRPDFRDLMHLGPEYNRNDFTEHGRNGPNLNEPRSASTVDH